MVKIAEAKARLSELLQRAEAGERVVISRGATPIVELRPPTASARTTAADEREPRLYSVASIHEVAFRARLGKLPIDPSGFRRALRAGGFTARSITENVILAAATLDWTNRDPWDRIIGATALREGARLVSSDSAFDELSGIERVW